MNGPLSGVANRPWTNKPRDTSKLSTRTRRILEQGEDAFVPSHEVTKYYNISARSLRFWAEKGEVRIRRLGELGKRLYNARDLKTKIVGSTEDKTDGGPHPSPFSGGRVRVAYARVSSSHQRGDLDRQVGELKRLCPHHEIVTDVASGLNWHRRGLRSLLDRCFEGVVEEVAVLHRDRLARFGVELLEYIFKKNNVRLLVVGEGATADSSTHEVLEAVVDPAQELADDLIAVTGFFMARHNGLRSAAHRRARLLERGDADSAMEEGTSGQNEDRDQEAESEESCDDQEDRERRGKRKRRGEKEKEGNSRRKKSSRC